LWIFTGGSRENDEKGGKRAGYYYQYPALNPPAREDSLEQVSHS